MARRDAVRCLGGQDLVGLCLAICPSLFLKTRLQIPATAAATKIVGPVGCHIHKVLFADHGFYDIPQIFGNRITQCFSNQLAGILNRKLDLSFFIPVRRGLEFSFPDPFGIKLNNTFDFKVVRDVKFLQSYQDCEQFVPSLGVEPDLTAQILHRFNLGPDNLFPVLVIC